MANDKTSDPAPAGGDSPRRTTMATPARSLDSKDKTGLFVGVATLAIDTGDKSTSTAIGLANDVRGELRVITDASIDALENIVRGVFRLTKRATARIDELAVELLGAGEKTARGVFGGLRDTTRAAGELATTAANAVIGGEKSVAQA
jgi:hypothetical protein